MNKIVSSLFSYIPKLEVLSRHLLLKKKTRVKKFKKLDKSEALIDKKRLISFLQINLKKDDVLIMHTRMSYLKRFGISPNELIEIVLNIIGNQGTLFIPNMPFYESLSNHKSYSDSFDEILTYDKASTKSWTGIVGDIFVKDFKAKRSDSPYCSLSGLGPFVDEAFSEELSDNLIFGPKSSWFKIMNKNAKILFLGAEAYDSITEAHLIEDNNDIFIKNGWRTPVTFNVLNLNKTYTFNIRKNYWNRFLSEFYNIRILKKKGLIKIEKIDGVELSCIHDFSGLYSFYFECIKNNKMPLFMGVPKKYLK